MINKNAHGSEIGGGARRVIKITNALHESGRESAAFLSVCSARFGLFLALYLKIFSTTARADGCAAAKHIRIIIFPIMSTR